MQSEELNGRQVVKGWPALVARAQSYHADSRVRHEGDSPCWDCACAPGQFHVPGCCHEVCPGCRGQLTGCSCPIAHEVLNGWPPPAGH